jgi:O-antigen ligase
VQLLAFVLLAWQLVRTRRDLAALLWGFVAGCVLVVALTWRAYFAGEFITWGRYAPARFDPNDMALYLALAVPMAAYLAVRGRGPAKVAAVAYFPAAISGIALSGSRGGLATALVATAGVLAWVAYRSRAGAILLVGILVGGIAVAGVTVPVDTWSRLFTLQEELNVGTAGDRKGVWSAGFALLMQHPLLGIGANGFDTAMVPSLHTAIVAHSMPLSVAVELGFVGLVLFYGAYGTALWEVWRKGFDERALAWILVMTLCVGSLALSWETRKPTWLVLLIAAAAGALRSPDDAEEVQ